MRDSSQIRTDRSDIRRWAAWLLAALLGGSVGCYDVEALTAASRQAENSREMQEIDLGKYYVTLPKMPGEAGGGVVSIHAFGRVARHDRRETQEALHERGTEVRANMLIALRKFTAEQLEDPAHQLLREQMAKVVNDTMKKDLVQQVVFLKFAFNPKN